MAASAHHLPFGVAFLRVLFAVLAAVLLAFGRRALARLVGATLRFLFHDRLLDYELMIR
jgi:hypothetical protein